MDLPAVGLDPLSSVGTEGQDGGAGGGTSFAVLDSSIHRDMRWCANCAGPRMFLEVFAFDGGILVCCQGCGEERVIPFTRMNSEVA
jgi:hypothetical protein